MIRLALLLGIAMLIVLLIVVRDVFQKMSGSGLILVAGLCLFFLGERVWGFGDWRAPVSGAGLLVITSAAVLRAMAMSRSTGHRQAIHRQALMWTAVVLAGLAVYGLTLETVTDMVGLDEAGTLRWNGAWTAIFPIILAVGAVPIFMLDRVLAVHPVMVPPGAARAATLNGLSAALAIALIFPINYLAHNYEYEWDYAYFRTTRPGESTTAIIQTLPEPIEALLFFSPGNDVGQQVLPYFKELEANSSGKLTVRMVDQALEPVLSEELKIRDNGTIALRQGDNHEPIKVGTDIDRAKRDLKKLDGSVQKSLIKLTKGQRTVYMLSGHGEASAREKEDRLRKLNLFKKNILEAQNLKVESFGVADGSTDEVPDDAAAVIVAAPMTELLPEESETLNRYWDNGGKLFVLLDPDSDPLPDVLGHLGVVAGDGVLAHAEAYIKQNRGPADRVLLATNKFGSHASVKTLSRQSQQMGIIIPTVRSVEKTADTQNKVSTLVRSYPETWVDLNNNRQPDADEEKKVFELAVAIEPAEGEARAIVVGDVNLFADAVLSVSRGNNVFALDGIRWLIGDDDIAGEISSEEDVKIVHTNDEDQIWFYSTVFAVPMFILMLGVVLVRRRRKES